MPKAGEVVRGALRLIGAVASGEVPSGAEQVDGLAALNETLSAWGVLGRMAAVEVNQTFPLPSLPAGERSLRIGTGQAIDTEAPITISKLSVLSGSRYVPWAPERDFEYERPDGEPFGCITFLKPLAGTHISITGRKRWLTLPQYDDTEELGLEPFVVQALRYDLARRIAPEYGLPLSEDFKAAWRDAMNTLRVAVPSLPMRCNVPSSHGYNIYIDR